MPRVRRSLPAAALIGLCLTLAACGGGGSGLSKAGLAEQANAICQQAAGQIKGIGSAPGDFQTNPKAAAAYLDKVVVISDLTVARLASLKPDDSAKAQWQSFIEANQAAARALDTARVKAEKRDPSGITDFENAVNSLQGRINATAKAIGATSCSG